MALPLYLSLIRHGESLANKALKAAATGDLSILESQSFQELIPAQLPLTKQGENQAQKAGKFLKENNLTERYDLFQTSGYTRAMQTAALLGIDDAQWMINHNLREREWGFVDHLDYHTKNDSLNGREHLLWWKPHNGENLADVMFRAWAVLSTLHRESETAALLVCHGEFIVAMQMLIEKLTDVDVIESKKEREVDNCEILEYTRVHPETNQVSPFVVASRRINADKEIISDWQIVNRKKYSNTDLLKMAAWRKHIPIDI